MLNKNMIKKNSKVKDAKEDIIFYFLAKEVQDNEGYHCEMPNVIFGHDGIDADQPAFYPFYRDEISEVVDYFDGHYDEFHTIYFFNNAPEVVDLYQKVKSQYKGVDIRLVNIKPKLFKDYNIDYNHLVNGYIVS